MFSRVRNFFRPVETATTTPPLVAPEALRLFIHHFPIGRKLRYYPEYQREIVFETLIIAYRVNETFLYSRDAVRCDAEGYVTAFQLAGKQQLPVGALQRLQLLVPDTSSLEKTLNYQTRAELGRSGQFRMGNTITLFVDTEQRGIPTVDTRVERRQVLKDGPYAENPTILVTPEFETLTLADKRRRQRVQTGVPAYLLPAPGVHPFPCILADFSDVSVRLSLRGGTPGMPSLADGASVVVEFALGDSDLHRRLLCRVMRRTEDAAVLLIDQLYKEGDFVKPSVMDLAEIKTGLLNA